MSYEEALRRIRECYETRATTLDLSGCDIEEIPIEAAQLTWLEELRMDGWISDDEQEGNLKCLPDWIGDLALLVDLSIESQQLESIPLSLGRLKNLQHLNLDRNRLVRLIDEISQLLHLKWLIVSDNMLTGLPDDLSHLSHLEYINASFNNLEIFPVKLCRIKNLNHLDLIGNQINSIPIDIGELSHLEYLGLGENLLNELPDSLRKLSKLSILILSGNKLKNIPPFICELSDLKALDVARNQIDEMPNEIVDLQKLQTLRLNDNKLLELPENISLVRELKYLTLDNNKLTKLPHGIQNLDSLLNLRINRNQLSELPSGIGKIKDLQYIDVSNNNLSHIPATVGYLKNIRMINIRNNPLSLPSELIPPSTRVFPPFFAYLRQLGEGESRRLNEAKVILVGEGTVGKTSLVRRLTGRPFDPGELKTDGIAIERWALPVDEHEVRLNVWDFGGQEIMHATHQFFLTKRSVYLLALNCRGSDHDNRLDYWLKLIQSFAPEAPVIVVGNKADQHPLDLDQRGLMLKYPQIKAFVATSCLDGRGIDELRERIIEQLRGLKHIGDVLPAAWWRVKQRLAEWRRDYISHDRFQEICEEEGIADGFVQKVLLGLLNDLGAVLSYHDDPRLAETNVLNPEWVTNGVYTLLNHQPLLEQRSGVLSSGELTAVLSRYDGRYPSHKCHFITEMMEKFELCFPLSRDAWLLPDLLPKEEPDTGDWGGALHFVYRYPVLPGSIISRFIVRSQHAIEGDWRWRNGAVLRSGGNLAMVKADPEDARIDIRVKGDEPNRRRMLSAIRHTFEQIHASLSGLRDEIEELVPLDGAKTLYAYKLLLRLESRKIKQHYLPEIDQEIDVSLLLDGYETPIERRARQVDAYEDAPIEHLEALLEKQIDLLRQYELQAIGFTDLHAPPHVLVEIKNLKQTIERIEHVLEEKKQGRSGRRSPRAAE